jgi:hypothetical protein
MATLPRQPGRNDPDDSACPSCGAPLACLSCGGPLELGDELPYCPSCSAPDDDVVLDLDAFRATVLRLWDAGVVNKVGEA